jgi:hypothetical protein
MNPAFALHDHWRKAHGDIYTGDQQSALLFVDFLSPVHPAERQQP